MSTRLARGEKGRDQESVAARRRKNLLAGAIVGLASIGVLAAISLVMSAGEPRRTREDLIANGEQAPAFSLPRLGGPGSVSPAAFKGKVLVLNFWHSQ